MQQDHKGQFKEHDITKSDQLSQANLFPQLLHPHHALFSHRYQCGQSRPQLMLDPKIIS